jgi:RNA polymerase sigma factor (sigma-70 family)
VALVSQDNAAAHAAASPHNLTAPCGFEAFYRVSYREVVKAAMIAGATLTEAEDAASTTYLGMLERWPVNGAPLRYARKAAVHNFIKDRTRGNSRVAQRLIERGPASVRQEGTEDAALRALEGRDWIGDVLSELSIGQREVMERITDGLDYDEIAAELGKSNEAIRRRVSDARRRLVQILNRDGARLPQPRHAAEEIT